MKTLVKGCLFLILIIILIPTLILGYFGYLPGISSLFGANKPRDLGIRYTKADLTSVRKKSQVVFEFLPKETPPEESRQFFGSREIKADFSSAEITAFLNNNPWRYWPYKNMQIKFNADGSAEVSGSLVKEKVPAYCSAIGIPKEAADFAMKFLPANPVFYVKGKGVLSNNQISLFEPEAFQLGRFPLPVGIFLSMVPKKIVKDSYALDVAGMAGELSKVKNKKALIVGYINNRLTKIPGFFAKTAYFADNKLVFEGTLPEKRATVK